MHRNPAPWLLLLAPLASAQSIWCPLARGGFGDSSNLLASICGELGGSLYVGTLNPGGAQLHAHDGTSFTSVTISGLTSDDIALTCGVVFQGELVVGTWNDVSGAGVWSYDGASWTQLGSGGAAPAIDRLAVFQGKLYAGLGDASRGSRVLEYQSPGSWIQRNPDGFGCGTANEEVYGLVEYAGQLYATANSNSGSQVWRWSGSGPWTRVDPGGVGGGGCGAGGFGSGGLDTGAHAASVAGSPPALYVGTESSSGAEVWRYDGA